MTTLSVIAMGMMALIIVSTVCSVVIDERRRTARISELYLSGNGWRLANGEYEEI